MADHLTNCSSREMNNLNPPQQVCWLCYSILDTRDTLSRKRGVVALEFNAVFEHRVSALLYAYCICDKIKDLEPKYIMKDFELKFEIGTQEPKAYPYRIFKIGNRSIHFNGSYLYHEFATSVYVVPVLIEGEGAHVVFTNFSLLGYKHLRIQKIRRVDKNYVRGGGNHADYLSRRFGCNYISTLISCPKHLVESDNSEKNIDTNYLSAIGSLYPLDIVSKLGDIISVIFPRTGLHLPHLPLYCIDRIVSFFSIQDVLRLLHYGLPSKNDFDSQRLKEDIFYSLPEPLISVPFKNIFLRRSNSIQKFMFGPHPGSPNGFISNDYEWADESSLLKSSSEEFWILFNESLKNPHSYLKNEIKINGIFRPLFVIPIEYQKGYIRNSILRIRSFLLKKNALHLVENEVINIQTISRIAGRTKVSFSTSLIKAIFTGHGCCCSWRYSALDKQSPMYKQGLHNVDWDEDVLCIQHPCRRQIIMLTEVPMAEDINEPSCEISRVEKFLPCIKTPNSQNNIHGIIKSGCDILQDDTDELRYILLAGRDKYMIEDPYTPYRRRLIHCLRKNFKRIYYSYVTNRAKFNLLPELWKLLADTFGISNYSIIKSEDEITPTAVQNDLVVISFRETLSERSIAQRLQRASAQCFRNNKSATSSSIATADDDETPCVQRNVLQLLWDEKLRLLVGKAKMDISRSGRLLHLCGLRGLRLSSVELGPFKFYGRNDLASEIYELVALLMPLKCRPVQVWFPDERLDFCSYYLN